MRATKRGAVSHDRTSGLSKRRGGIGTAASVANNGNGAQKFAIFSDENGSASTGPPPSAGGMKVWSDLPAERVVTKENTGKAGKWNSGGVGGSKDSNPLKHIDVFDDGSGAVPAAEPGPSVRKELSKRILRQCKENKAHTVTLKDFARERGHQRQTTDGFLGYDPSPLFSGAEEMCFEELRGKAWLTTHTMVVLSEADCALDVEMEDVPSKGEDQQPELHQENPYPGNAHHQAESLGHQQAAKKAFGIFADGENRTSEAAPPTNRGGHKSPSVAASVVQPRSAPAPSGVGYSNGMPSPTINTREAMADLMAMFSAPIGAESPSAGNASCTGMSLTSCAPRIFPPAALTHAHTHL